MKSKRSAFDNLFLTCGILMAASEIWKQCYLTFRLNSGCYDWWFFPFQLCSISMYLCLMIPFVRSMRVKCAMVTFLSGYGILGGVAAFFDTSGMHYPVLSLTVHSYAWHILLIALGIIASRYLKRMKNAVPPEISSFQDSTFIYALCCVIATFFNLSFSRYGEINMFYINPLYTMHQIGFRTLTPYIGTLPCIFVYIGCTILGAWILHRLSRHFLHD